MNLTSFTLAGALRARLLLIFVPAFFMARTHFENQSQLMNLTQKVMQAMELQAGRKLASSNCTHVPDNPTLAGLVSDGLLDEKLITDSPWTLSIRYESSDNGVVIGKTLILTAIDESQGEILRSNARSLPVSWHYESTTYTLTVMAPAKTYKDDVMRQDFNTVTGCFSW